MYEYFRKSSQFFCNTIVTYYVYGITYLSLMNFNKQDGLLALNLKNFSVL